MARINSKKKGAKGERMAIAFLKEWSGKEFERTPASGGLRWKKSDNIAGDIICTEPNYIFPCSIEVKNHRDIDFSKLLFFKPGKNQPKIWEFWHQACLDAVRAKKIPLLMVRYNGLPKNFFFFFWSWSSHKFILESGLKIRPILVLQGKLIITTTEALKEISYVKFKKAMTRHLKDKHMKTLRS